MPLLSRSSCLLERGLLIISRRKLRNDGNLNRKLLLSLILIGVLMNFSNIYFFFLILPFYHLFFYQIKFLKINQPKICLEIFKSNNILGIIICINILIGKFF